MDSLWNAFPFGGLAHQCRFDDLSQTSSEDWQKLRELKGLQQQITEIGRDVFLDVLSNNWIQHAVERGGAIAEANRDIVEQEAVLVYEKRCFWPILELNRNLVISHQQLEGYEAMRVVKVFEDLVDASQGGLILLGLLIVVSIINPHPEPAILLWDHYDVACIGTKCWIRR